MSAFAAAVAWWSPSPLLPCHDCCVVATIPTGPHCYCNCRCWCIVAALREEEFTCRGGGHWHRSRMGGGVVDQWCVIVMFRMEGGHTWGFPSDMKKKKK